MPQPSGNGSAAPRPLWFGPEGRPLFGWLHLPADGRARGGVVLCQPLGIEAICTYYTYRLLAEELTGRGLAVLRFDYDGTGDSSGLEADPDRVDHWLASVATASDLLAGLGTPKLALAGIRMGGLFAAEEAVRRGGVDALVLWDACPSGAAFLREQRFLRLVNGSADTDDGAVEAPGLRFEAPTVRALAELDLTRSEGTLADRVLVLTPPELSRPRRLQRRLVGHRVDWQEATGQDRLLDSTQQAPPADTITRTADWVATVLDDRPAAVTMPPAPGSTVVGSVSGRNIVERTVRVGGPDLFGIVTEPDHGTDGPTIVLVDEGNTHHIGQARIWVDLARRLAPFGLRTIRFDLSGNGDSGSRPGQATHVARAPEAIDDVYEAMCGCSPDDPTDVVLVGFCSGAYQVVEQALRHPPRGICVINPSFSFLPPEQPGSADRPARQRSRRWFARLAGPPLHRVLRDRSPAEARRWTKALEVGSWPVALATRFPRVPAAVWWVVGRTMIEHPGSGTLQRVVRNGVDTLLVCGPGDFLPISLGAEGRIERLRRTGAFRVEILDELDHASWVKRQRDRLIDVVESHLVTVFGPDPSGSEDSVTEVGALAGG